MKISTTVSLPKCIECEVWHNKQYFFILLKIHWILGWDRGDKFLMTDHELCFKSHRFFFSSIFFYFFLLTIHFPFIIHSLQVLTWNNSFVSSKIHSINHVYVKRRVFNNFFVIFALPVMDFADISSDTI